MGTAQPQSPRIRVVLVGLRGLLGEMIVEAVKTQPDMVWTEVETVADARDSLRHNVDLFITRLSSHGASPELAMVSEMGIPVLAIRDDGAVLYERGMQAREFRDVSLSTVLALIRAAARGQRADEGVERPGKD